MKTRPAALTLSSHRCVCGEPIARGERRGGQVMTSGTTWFHGTVDHKASPRVQQTAAQRRLDTDHTARLA
ncbi:hypothetical protein [Nocardia sp. NRRL S-836]|uniref:hypothetical protein n=1 Tax=Nocardia sp. NRRL S-836 TaxID=1519492 RepID=UPI0006B059E6|nr:hypothetical protein [Nocardia sp. NRRL S-836]KOV84756.1 hypothetical protein ADL03_15950 [Nocardia sp. NRRL S-836]